MKNAVWLSTFTTLRVCSSVRQAVAIGAPGDHIHQDCEDGCNAPAALASHKIVATRTGGKRAVRIAPKLVPCGCGGACMLCDDNGMVSA
jgi:hypothetical protein